jgi:hypothetical protein
MTRCHTAAVMKSATHMRHGPRCACVQFVGNEVSERPVPVSLPTPEPLRVKGSKGPALGRVRGGAPTFPYNGFNGGVSPAGSGTPSTLSTIDTRL